MAYGNFGKKKSVKDKFNDAVKKVVAFGLLGGALATPVYYEFGTVKEQDVVIQSQQDNTTYDFDTGKRAGNYIFETDKGTFKAERSRIHMQSQEEAREHYTKFWNGRTYRVKTYGLHLFGNWQPNIISSREVSQSELDARVKRVKEEEAKAAAAKEQQQQAPAGQQQSATPFNAAARPAGAATPQAGCALSGEMATYPVVVNGYSVQITVPAELSGTGRVTVNSVRPLTPPPPAP